MTTETSSSPPPALPPADPPISALRKLIVLVLGAVQPADRVAFVASATGPKNILLPKTFEPGDYAGLELCYVVQGSADSDTLVTIWHTRDHYLASGQRCFATLAVRESGAGWVTRVAEKSQSRTGRIGTALKRPSTIITLLATSAAILGNLSTLRSGVQAMFTRPACEMLVAEPSRRLPRSDRPATLELKITNPGEVDATVTLTRITIDGSETKFGLPSRPPRVPKIATGKDATVALPFVPSERGQYVVNLRGSASNGWGFKQSLDWSVVIAVWDPIRVSSLSLDSVASGGSAAVVKATVEIGRAAGESGFLGVVRLVGEPGVVFNHNIGVTGRPPLKVKPPITAGTGDNRLALIEWESPGSVTAFSTQAFYLRLTAPQPLSRPEWERIVGRLQPDVGFK